MGKKTVVGEDGKRYRIKEKKPFYKKWWFWLIVVVLIIAIGGNMGGKDKKSSSSSTEISTKIISSKDTKNSSSAESTKNESSDLKNSYDAITLGDILSGSDGGSSLDTVKATFGEPASTSSSQLEGVTTDAVTWSGLKGAGITSSLIVMFSNGSAVNKAISGLKVSKHDKVTLDTFNAIATDGTYSFDTAKSELGDPTGLSETIVNGQHQILASWTSNVNGDLGANFNITFNDGVASGKSQYSMK